VTTPAPAGDASADFLEPGDAVRITVWQRPEMSGEFVVSRDGHLIHPVFRSMNVRGLTPSQIEAQVRVYLTRFESDPQFTVEPLIRLVISGEVRQPGILSVPPGTTVRQAIFEAGGVTTEGVLNRARVVRGGTMTTLDLLNAPGMAMPVQSGDEIVVARRRSILRDFIAPVGSVVGGLSGLAHLILRLTD
jgi:polysaccharide export outer membrane protein